LPRGSALKAELKPQARTRTGNGKELLAGIDGRSVLARRVREVLGQIITDMGGDPSEAQLAIAKRAATLVTWCESVEASFLNGEEFDVAIYGTSVNTLRRLLESVGLERRSKDITPNLRDYVTRTYGGAQ
jgi:hypothetical protein